MKHITAAVAALFLISGIAEAQSLYADIKARSVGDVISVIIVESANASRESRNKSDSDSDLKTGASVSGNVMDFLPVFGANTSYSSSYDGSDGSEQRDRLTGKITVQITERTDTGMFRIKGERNLNVNGETNLMQLEGLVRPRDITTDNTVMSYQLADAKITYRKGGIVNSVVKPGTFTKLFTGVLGLLAIAVAGGVIIL